MSSLNLTPNPTIMMIEAGVFLVNFLIVKKLLLEPYLGVNAKRKQLTEGNQSQAEHLEIANQQSAQKIQSHLRHVADESRTIREQALLAAKGKRDAIVSNASEDAGRLIESMRNDLNRELAAEQALIPALVERLTQEFVQKLVPA